MSPQFNVRDEELGEGLFAVLNTLFSKAALEEVCAECEFCYKDKQSFCTGMFEWVVYGLYVLESAVQEHSDRTGCLPFLQDAFFGALSKGSSTKLESETFRKLAEASLKAYRKAGNTHNRTAALGVKRIFNLPPGTVPEGSELGAMLRAELEGRMEQTFSLLERLLRPVASASSVESKAS